MAIHLHDDGHDNYEDDFNEHTRTVLYILNIYTMTP
jgi:hypothetical protein